MTRQTSGDPQEAGRGREGLLEAENARLRAALAHAGVDVERALSETATVQAMHQVRDATVNAVADRAREMDEGCAELADAAALNEALRRANAARALSEDRLRAVLASATDYAIIATDLDGRVTGWNEGAYRTLGWAESEMLWRDVRVIWTPEDRAAGVPGAEMRTCLAQGTAADERWHMRRDGTRFWAQGQLTPLCVGGGSGAPCGFLKILRDRTAEHQGGQALRQAEAALRRAQAAGGVGVFSVDIEDNVLKATPEFCRLFGVPVRDRMAPKEVEDLVLPEYAALASNAATRNTGDIAPDVEYRIRRPDTGEVRWISRRAEVERDGAGRPVRFIGVVRDITVQRAAQDALVRSEERYRALFEAIDEGFCIIEFLDGPHGPLSDYVHVEANPGYERHTGIPDIVGKTIRDLAPEEADGWVELYGGVLRTGQPIRFERDFVRAGRHIEVSAARVEPASRRQVSVLFRDVTARKRAEAALREQEARLRLATSSARLGTFDYRVQANELTWDDRCCELFGLPPGGAVSYERTFLAGLHPEDRAQAVEAVERSMDPAGSGLFAAEYRTIGLQDGIERWVSANGETLFENGTPARLIGTVLDITERKRADAALRASEALARENIQRVQLALAAGAIIGTWFWDIRADRFTGDEAFARVFGLDPAIGRVGLSLEQVVATVHPDDKPAMTAAREEAIARGGAYAHQYRVRRADGRYYWIEANGRVELAPDGTPLSLAGVLIDVEGRRAVEAERDRVTAELRALTETLEQRVADRTAELMRAEEQLRQSQKMEAVGQLTGGLAHDFNNLLIAITGSLELLGTRVTQGRYKDLSRYVGAAQGAAGRAAALTHRLLAFSRRQTLDPKPTDVNRLIGGIEELIRRAVGPTVKIEVVGAVGLWPTLVDPHQLENALLNLCINARDAMADGGRLTIETANRWLDQRAAQERDLVPGQYVSLCISDTGTGMTPDVIAKAFDPFFTTKPLGQGTGLGLSMVYGFARQSGGQVRIYSEPGQGTTVCLYLLRYLGEADMPEAMPDLADALRADDGETVLVVDDEPTVRMLVTEVLEELGYAAIEASDGASGLRVLQSDARVDLLVTDVGLPGGMNGRQMADAARMARPELRVLFITGYAENAVIGNGHLEPGMHVMTKPFAMEALASRIKELLTGQGLVVKGHPSS